jgi:alpha-acetolactate decarboxylase
VPRQRKPYPPLVEVVGSQPTFELRGVAGSLVGFRFPQYAQGINVAGYHFHFITDDRSAGATSSTTGCLAASCTWTTKRISSSSFRPALACPSPTRRRVG